MDNIQFCRSFNFRLIARHQASIHDSSKGSELHFFARLQCGSGRLVGVDGESISVNTGDVFYIPKNFRYVSYWYPDESGAVRWESYGLTFLPIENDTIYKLQVLDADGDVRRILDNLCSDMSVSVESIASLFLVMARLMPTMSRINEEPQTRVIVKARSYMYGQTDFSVPELARICNMSESGLYAFFNKYVGCTPVEMKNSIRVENATKLLMNTDYSIEEISDKVGFRSVSHFRKLLKKHTGKTPRDLRKELTELTGL